MYDTQSKQLFLAFLSYLGFYNITDTDTKDKFYYLDITADYRGGHFGFELKNRLFPSYYFNDIMCDASKGEKAREDLKKGVYKAVYVVNIYTDNKIGISNIINGVEEELSCSLQTMFANHDVVHKKTLHFPLDKVYLISNTAEGLKFTRVSEVKVDEESPILFCDGTFGMFGLSGSPTYECPRKDSCVCYSRHEEFVGRLCGDGVAIIPHAEYVYSINSENCIYYKKKK